MSRAFELEDPAPVERRPLRGVDRLDFAPAPGEVAIDVAACAICRTDLQIIEGDLGARRLPIVPGHQAVGRIRAVGDGVTNWQPGNRVGVAWLASACGRCDRCLSGRENLCPRAEFTGWDRDGGFAETMNARADFVFSIPPGFGDAEAAPLLCGGIIGYRALRLSGIEPGGKLGLYGFGASALLAFQVARHWGCDVFVATRSRIEQERALAMGAAWAGSYHDQPPAELDAAITFAPAGYVVIEALKAIKPGGTVAINAIHLDTVPEFPYELLWMERGIRSVANFTRQDANEFLALAAEIPIETVTDRYPLRDVNIALGRLKAGEVDGAAVLTT
ncbi:MAG: zinc-dependent alcohol dehydrogenase family protein [Acidimicrobiia bacterium]|nr:zinc-dependent alcohol dehydrogenase family protein [Acidimicrobiia bacterium]